MRFTKRLLFSLGLLLLPSSQQPAYAHGVNGHVWVTDGGLERMFECTFAGDVLADPKLRAIAQIGAGFPDSGYVFDAGREYGETAHWEPFVQAYIDYLRRVYKPPYDTQEELELIAFLFGLSAHGMEDETFDTIFLRKSFEAEGTDQDILDAGTDFMLIAEGHTKLKPDVFLPSEDLLAVYADPKINVQSVTPEMMEEGMFIIRNVVISLVDQDETLDDKDRPKMPWTSQYYVDPKTPGSLEWEKSVIGPYFDALWNRLHGEFRIEDFLIQTVPAEGERTLSNDHLSVDSHITLVLGYGVWYRSVTADRVKLLDPGGQPVPIQIAYTRWGNSNSDGRIIQLRPQVDLQPNAQYTAVLEKGIELIDGSTLPERVEYKFTSACAGTCEPLPSPKMESYCKAVSEATKKSAADLEKPADGGCASMPVGSLLLIGLPVVLLAMRRAS